MGGGRAPPHEGAAAVHAPGPRGAAGHVALPLAALRDLHAHDGALLRVPGRLDAHRLRAGQQHHRQLARGRAGRGPRRVRVRRQAGRHWPFHRRPRALPLPVPRAPRRHALVAAGARGPVGPARGHQGPGWILRPLDGRHRRCLREGRDALGRRRGRPARALQGPARSPALVLAGQGAVAGGIAGAARGAELRLLRRAAGPDHGLRDDPPGGDFQPAHLPHG
mmetsp:Transcript_100146/g.283639  ORF Transcript_100146/g.283639 Transcript_100146/m.283639 type:complete len:222 (-) Transcript_100146:549-1214(-)